MTVATAYETVLYLKDYSEFKGEKIYFIQGLETWAAKEEKVLETWRLPFKKIVISQYLFEKGNQVGILDLVKIPNAIEHQKYKVYNDWHKRDDCIIMMYSNASVKGADYGIRAICDLKELLPDVKIVLFGKVKKPEGLPEGILYYENPEQEFIIKEIYNKAKILLFPSLSEGWGLPAMEAMACGTAVVTTDCGGIRDFAIPNETALVCPVKDVESMKEAMYKLLTNNQLRERLIENALQKVKEYNWDKSTERFLEVINQTVNTQEYCNKGRENNG